MDQQEDVEASGNTVYGLRARRSFQQPSSIQVVQLEQMPIKNDGEKFQVYHAPIDNTELYKDLWKEKDDIDEAREEVNKMMDSLWDKFVSSTWVVYLTSDEINPDWNPRARKIIQRMFFAILFVFVSVVGMLLVINGSKFTPKMTIQKLTPRFTTSMLGPFESMETYEKLIKPCRQANQIELSSGNFILHSNDTHRLHLNLNETRDMLFYALLENHTDFMCASMLHYDYNMPCACAMTHENDKPIFLINFHVIHISKKQAHLSEEFPILSVPQPINRTIPTQLDLEYYDMGSGKQEKLHLEQLYVNVFMHILEFVGSYFGNAHSSLKEVK